MAAIGVPDPKPQAWGTRHHQTRSTPVLSEWAGAL